MEFKTTFMNNWKAIISVLAAICTIVTTAIYIDERYAHTVTVTKQFERLNAQTDQLLLMTTSQLETRKTILELKEASDTITPSEIVELKNLRELFQP